MTTIYLIGFMGSGKSSIGKKLSEMMDVTQADTDIFVEEKHQMSIADIFKNDGESAYSTYETEALKQITDKIISTGGGIVEKDVNRSFMRKNGFIIYLQTSFDTIARRLQNDQERPLWQKNMSDQKKMYERRAEMYKSCCEYIVVTDNKSINEIAKEIINLLKC